jgi:putative membrane protein
MTKLFFKYLSIILSIYIASLLLDTVQIGNDAAIWVMGLVLFAVNLVLKPVLLILALPLNLLTFGLFSFVVNALTIMLSDFLVPEINMGGFLNSLLTALIIVLLNHLLPDRSKPGRGHK